MKVKKKVLIAGIILIGLITLNLSQAQAAKKDNISFYVASDGKDNNPGTKRKPFATLKQARNAIRELKRKNNGQLPLGTITVWIRGGIYFFSQSLKFKPEDSGTVNSPIVYRAYRNEKVHLIGGQEVTGFKPISEPHIRKRIEPTIRSKIKQVNLKKLGITDFGELLPGGLWKGFPPQSRNYLELFFQEKPMQLARWPNKGWTTIAGVPVPKGRKFTYKGSRPERWSDIDGIMVHGYWKWDWADSYERVKAINTLTKEVTTDAPGVYGYSAGKRYYFLNILEELDEPGEWYLDRKTGILYFWPPASLSRKEVYISILKTPLLSLHNVSYVTIRNLIVECTRGAGVEIVGGAHNLIAGCTIRNTGTVGVSIGTYIQDAMRWPPDTTFNYNGGTDNGVVGCDIYHTGEGGIALTGGNRKTLTPGKNFAVNNYLYDCSRIGRTFRPAIFLLGVGNYVAHNLIHSLPHIAILLAGNEHLIEYNRIHHVGMETRDAGAIYTGRDWSQRGTIIRYNFLSNIGRKDINGVYLDDFTSGITVFGNIFYKVSWAAVLLGGGRDNIIENNIFIDCNPAVWIDARGIIWSKNCFDGTNNVLFDRLDAVNYTQPPYSLRYPRLLNVLNDEPALPKNNKIVGNICSGGQWLKLLHGAEKFVTIKDNLLQVDPGFVSARKLNFQLKSTSPAYRLGFKRIPMEKIGLQRDEFRQTMPGDNLTFDYWKGQ